MPSPGNLIEGEETAVLGFVWEMMMKFMKFETEDDAESLSAADALLKWTNYHLLVRLVACCESHPEIYDIHSIPRDRGLQ